MMSDYIANYLFNSTVPSDYTAFTRSLAFNSVTRSQTVTVTIRDDNVVEQQFEYFRIYLRTSYYDPAVILNPVTANVNIEDDDSKLTLQHQL